MDESLSSRRTIRRLALFAALNCAITCAGESPIPPSDADKTASSSDLRSFLTRGWNSAPSKTTPLPLLPKPTPEAESRDANVTQPADATIVRPQPKTLVVADKPDTQLKAIEAKSQTQAIQLSDLLKQAPPIPSDRRTISRPAKVVSLPSKLVDQSLELPSLQSRKQELLASAARKNGFGLLAIDQIAPPEVLDETPTLSATAIIHANKLQEMSRQMLQESANALRRGATFTARKKATAALRSVIAMRDAQQGGNQNARQLEAAEDAIRESRDFGLGMHQMQTEAIERLVDIHNTVALKDKPLAEVSPLHATESYLACAKENFVGACGSVSEASYALTLLGKIEQRSHQSTNPHALAIALTYQRAAVEIDSSNAYAYYEMGKTLLNQGLVQQAHDALLRSVELSPNRGSYQKLLVAARKLGDIDAVRRCNLALDNQQLPTEIPVLQLNMMDFAAMHRPPANRIAQSNTPTPEPPTRHVSPSKKPATAPKSTSRMTRLRNWFSADAK